MGLNSPLTLEEERIAVISGDGAYDTRTVYEASTARNSALLVPPRRNGKPWKTRTAGADERNETLRAIKHLGRRLWKRWSGYHRRSLAETAMSRFKRLGERLAARDPARQVAEVQIRCVILNTCNRLGMPDTVALTWSKQLAGSVRPHPDFRNSARFNSAPHHQNRNESIHMRICRNGSSLAGVEVRPPEQERRRTNHVSAG